MARVTFTPEAAEEARALLVAARESGGPDQVLRIGIGSCGLRRAVAAPAKVEVGDEQLSVEGIPLAIASTLPGAFHLTLGRGRFGAWLNVEHRA